MLKKIVKYGNSCALILDKAILELLDMEEGSVVKIKTNGVSLIITPQHTLVKENISPTLTIEKAQNDAVRNLLTQSFDGDSKKAKNYQKELEELCDYRRTMVEENKNKPEQQDSESKLLDQEMHTLLKKYSTKNSQNMNSTNMSSLIKEFKEVHEKHKRVIDMVSSYMQTEEYIHEMALLAEKHQGNHNSKEFIEAQRQLISKKIPEYATYQSDLKKVAEKTSLQIEKKANCK